ncbi:NAD-dependent epimerase/dehydratase family protein [Halopiger djelfimassiliensis]|uniref:NAD-dependent epimerase/dehydratase family protein n=1 Tax=Halopiger djelfimassiliensis TaxID=1293047 RepID=UPI000677A119|nr:NAD-dependent epimerase/dehydratase family protein [Halopiger djelfimassiliensis]
MDWANSTVLVTGGAGFIGSHLVDELLRRDADVVVADDLSRGSLENIDHVVDDIDLRPVDLTTQTGALRATEGVDHVFHLAASVGGIHYIQRENVGGLTPSVLMNQQLLEAARINDVETFLFASSACIYRQEHDELNRFSEEQAIPADPHSTYGWAKVLGEVACQAYHDDCDIDTAMVRIFNCYGPRESLDPDSSHVIPSLCRKVIEEPDGGSIELFGDGTQERGFIYVTDLVNGMIRTIESKADGDPINLGNGQEVVTINELAETIIEISGKDISIEHDLSMPTGTDKYAADTAKMEQALDWSPTTTLESGLSDVYEWAAEELDAKDQAFAEVTSE